MPMRDACVNGIVVIRMQKAYENLICFCYREQKVADAVVVVIVK